MSPIRDMGRDMAARESGVDLGEGRVVGVAAGVAFGKLALANPDLVERLRRNAPLNEADKASFYGGDARGYTDYPTLAEVDA